MNQDDVNFDESNNGIITESKEINYNIDTEENNDIENNEEIIIVEHKDVNSTKNQMIEELTKQLSQALENGHSHEIQSLKEIQDQKNEYELIISGLHQQLLQEQECVRQLQQKVEDLQDKLNERIEQNNIEQQQSEQLQNEIKTKQSEEKQLYDSEIQKLLIEIENINLNNTSLVEQLNLDHRNQLQNIQNTNLQLIEQLNQQHQQLLDDRQLEYQNQFEELKVKYEEQLGEVKDKNKMITDLNIQIQDELKQLKETNQMASEQKGKEFSEQIEQLQQNLVYQQQEAELLQRQRLEQDDLIQSLQRQQSLQKDKDQSIETLRIQMFQQQEHYLSQEQEYEKKIIVLTQKHESQYEDLNRVIQELKQQLAIVMSEGIQMEKNLHEMASKKQELEQENGELKQKNTQSTQSLQELQQYLLQQEEDYGAQFENQNKVILDLKNSEAQLYTRIEGLELKLKENKDQQTEKQQQAEKMVTIPVTQLLQWEKRSKDQQGQIKILQTENGQLKSQIEDQARLQNSKQMKSNLSLEGMNQRCVALQQIIDSTSIQNQKQETEILMLRQINQQLKEDLHNSQMELKDLRIIAQDKFRLEEELQQQLMVMAEHTDQSKQMKNIQEQFEKCQLDYEQCQKQQRHSEQLRVKIQQKYEDTYEELQKSRKELQETIFEKDQKSTKSKDLEKLLSQQFQEFSILEQKYKDQCLQNEDLKNQQKITQKKYLHECEQLKEELILKQKQNQQLEEQNHNMVRDLQILRDHQFKLKSTEAPITKKEKIVVESLSARVSELELENRHIKDQTAAKILQLQSLLDAKILYIQAVSTQLCKSYPNLEESDLLDKEEVKFVLTMKKKPNLQEIIEKTLIENLQLREQIRVLGSELNKRY